MSENEEKKAGRSLQRAASAESPARVLPTPISRVEGGLDQNPVSHPPPGGEGSENGEVNGWQGNPKKKAAKG